MLETACRHYVTQYWHKFNFLCVQYLTHRVATQNCQFLQFVHQHDKSDKCHTKSDILCQNSDKNDILFGDKSYNLIKT